MTLVEAYIAMGSNIEPAKHVPAALARIRRVAEVVAVSTFYRTKPLERPEQPDYRNGAVQVRTRLSRAELDETMKKIESELGRIRSEDRYGARTIDLDVAVYCATAEAAWMDQSVAERNFVAVPLAELSPDLALPGGRTASEIADALGRDGLDPDEALTHRLREDLKHEQNPR